MPGEATRLGPFKGGLHNSSGNGEFIEDDELFECTNLEVDVDGSLANRPEIKIFNTSGWQSNGASFLGTYMPNDGRKFIVAYSAVDDKVYLLDSTTGAANVTASPVGVTSVACIQYNNRLFVISKTGASANGGYFDAPTASTITWTTVAAIPRGEAITQYKERLWIACGLSATSNTSRFFFSGVGSATDTWGGTDYVDVAPGNGQKLVSLVRLGNDLLLFKEHSTHRFNYSVDPRKAELSEIDAQIGVPAINCVVVYNNNTVYVLHDNAVYELFQITYSRISANINMIQESDLDLYAKDQYGLTLHRDRLFVRYFKNLFVFSLRVKRWSTWVTDRKFSKVVVIPSATVGLDTAYAMSGSQDKPTESYYFQDSRITNDSGQVEVKTPTLVTPPGGPGVTGGATSVAIPVSSGAVEGDWVYLFFVQNWTVNEAAPTPPAGFIPVVARRQAGTAGSNTGMEWMIWRKKRTATDGATYTVTMPSTHACHGVAISINGASDNSPVLGSIVGTRAARNPSTTTINSAAGVVPQDSIMLAFWCHMYGLGSAVGGQTWTNATHVTNTNNASAKTQMWAGIQTNPSNAAMKNVGISFPQADSGVIGGVCIQIPVAEQSITPSIERFQAVITSKTYDFDTPQSYKVQFWWGVGIATSGRLFSKWVIPNATPNKTWRQARDEYSTWPTAQSAGQQWSSTADVYKVDEISPSLGRYARKIYKLLGKQRFRQSYYTLIMDVVTNNGIADASLRLYDLTVFLKQKQTVTKEVT